MFSTVIYHNLSLFNVSINPLARVTGPEAYINGYHQRIPAQLRYTGVTKNCSVAACKTVPASRHKIDKPFFFCAPVQSEQFIVIPPLHALSGVHTSHRRGSYKHRKGPQGTWKTPQGTCQ